MSFCVNIPITKVFFVTLSCMIQRQFTTTVLSKSLNTPKDNMEPLSLLNMLAEIASEKLKTDPLLKEVESEEKTSTSNGEASYVSTPGNSINQGKRMTLLQVLSISENTVLRLFTISQSNELQRKFYYTCRLIPQECEETFHSFGSEEKARNLTKKHLKQHLGELAQRFKDPKSQKNYILYTVGKGCRHADSDLKRCRINKKTNKTRPKTESKPKGTVETENSTKILENKDFSESFTLNTTLNAQPVPTLNTTIKVQPVPTLNTTVKVQPATPNFETSIAEVHEPAITLSESDGLNSSNSLTPVSFEAQLSFNDFRDSGIKESKNGRDLQRVIVNNNDFRNDSNFNHRYNEILPQMTSSSEDRSSPCYNNISLPIYVNNIPTATACAETKDPSLTRPMNANHFLNYTLFEIKNENRSVTDGQQSLVYEGDANPNRLKTEIIDIKEEIVELQILESPSDAIMKNSFSSHYAVDTKPKYSVSELQNSPDQEIEQRKSSLMNPEIKPHKLLSQANLNYDMVKTSSESEFERGDDPENFKEFRLSQERKKKVKLRGKGKYFGQTKDEKEKALFLIERMKTQPHLQPDNLQCNICDPPRLFTASATLLSHYKSHAGIRPYVCMVCNAEFTRQHSLNYHNLIHKNQTRFTCSECGRKFRHPSHFREHLRRHTGESPYECNDCLMKFKTRNTYKRHLRTRHGKKLGSHGTIGSVSDPDKDTEKGNTENYKEENVNETASTERTNNQNMEASSKTLLKDDVQPHTNTLKFLPLTTDVVNALNVPSKECTLITDVVNAANANNKDCTDSTLPSGSIKTEVDDKQPTYLSHENSTENYVVSTAELSTKTYPVNYYVSDSSNLAPLNYTVSVSGHSSLPVFVPVTYVSQVQNSSSASNGRVILLLGKNSSIGSSSKTAVTANCISENSAENVQTAEDKFITYSLAPHENTNRGRDIENICDKPPETTTMFAQNNVTPYHSLQVPVMTNGSILNALLTTNRDQCVTVSIPESNTEYINDKMEGPLTSTYADEHTSDNWDTLMREVLSLSTAVKEKA